MPESSLSPLAVTNSRPTLRVDNQEFAKLDQLLLAMEMTEGEGGLSSLELRLSNFASDPSGGADFAFEDGTILKLGATIAVYSGATGSPQEIFQGVITGLEAEFPEGAPPELVVLAEDALQQARMHRRTKIHNNTSIANLARDLASQLSLTPVVTGLTDPIEAEVQLDESDLAFLRRLLRRYDADIQVVGKELHVSPVQNVQRGLVELALNSQLIRARCIADLSCQVTASTASGWNVKDGSPVSASSTGTNFGPGAGRKGAELLQSALGARKEHVAGPPVGGSDEAQTLAATAFDQRARSFVRVEGVAQGNPALRAGTHVKLTGLGPRFTNTYYVMRAQHCYDLSNGYRTEFEAQCAYLGAP